MTGAQRFPARIAGVILAACLGTTGCQPKTRPGPLDATQTPSAATGDLREFVHRVHVHGVPYSEAIRFGPESAPALTAMLNDPAEKPHHSNIAVTLCMVGDEAAADTVINFIQQGPPGDLSRSDYQAKSNAVMALGYLVNRTGSRRALDFLKQSLDPKSWSDRNIPWKAEYQRATSVRDAQLSTMATLGLALSGHPEARSALRNLQLQPATDTQKAFSAQVSATVTEALKDHEEISRDGLATYYAKRRR
ncbi:MAG: hypothetical protein FLDDKLPJ_02681 [Phycisphaerae bacterium]|nr:hypothetical protein [Phycisphaerae bacterium]